MKHRHTTTEENYKLRETYYHDHSTDEIWDDADMAIIHDHKVDRPVFTGRFLPPVDDGGADGCPVG